MRAEDGAALGQTQRAALRRSIVEIEIDWGVGLRGIPDPALNGTAAGGIEIALIVLRGCRYCEEGSEE